MTLQMVSCLRKMRKMNARPCCDMSRLELTLFMAASGTMRMTVGVAKQIEDEEKPGKAKAR